MVNFLHLPSFRLGAIIAIDFDGVGDFKFSLSKLSVVCSRACDTDEWMDGSSVRTDDVKQ